MKDYQARVIKEAKELSDKTSGLDTYMKSGLKATLDEQQQELLEDQFEAMKTYLDILHRRIEQFA